MRGTVARRRVRELADAAPVRPAVRLRLAVALGAVVLAGLSHAARAQVLEIGDGGAVTIYDRPMRFSSDGAVPITLRSNAVHRTTSRAVLPAEAVATAADQAALSPELVAAVAWQESRFRPGAVSRAGAVGEMQLMPGTARALGVDPYDSRQNYRGGATYLSSLMRRYDGDLVRALAAYNAGPGAVDRYRGVPPYGETKAYVSAVLDRLSQGVAATERVGR